MKIYYTHIIIYKNIENIFHILQTIKTSYTSIYSTHVSQQYIEKHITHVI